MKFLNLSFVIVLSGFALQVQQVKSANNAEMIAYVQSNFPWMTSPNPYFVTTSFLDPKLGKGVTMSNTFGKHESDQSNFLYEKKITGTPGLEALLANPKKVVMNEDEFLICGKVAGEAPRCFGRLKGGEEIGSRAVHDWQRFGIHPIKVHGAEAMNYAQFQTLEKEYDEHVRKEADRTT